MHSIHQIIQTINKSTYKLDMSGVVGMLGGENAVDAIETIHLYAGRRWVGWYNYPGTLSVAKEFGQMANSRFWDSLFPGTNESPAVTFKLDGKLGPEYSGAFSDTQLQTGYLGYLMAEESRLYASKPLELVKKDKSKGRVTGSAAAVTIVSLPSPVPKPMTTKKGSGAKFIPIDPIHPTLDTLIMPFAILPTLVSTLAWIFCFLTGDPLGASLILLGIMSSGISSFVLGSAKLYIRVPNPSASSPPGDGLMLPADGSIIVLKGEEADVNVVTKGQFELDYSTGVMPHEKHHSVGFSSLLLMAQFLVQLLLIPRCTFFGQILFLVSFVASGGYHLYVVSHEREHVHRLLLSRELSGRMEKRVLGTRTQMAVFVCLVLGNGRDNPSKSNPGAVLSRIIPNKTPVWKCWKKKVVRELENFWKWDQGSSSDYDPQINAGLDDVLNDEFSKGIEDTDEKLLKDLIDDAWCVFKEYPQWRDRSGFFRREVGEYAEEKAHLLRSRSPV